MIPEYLKEIESTQYTDKIFGQIGRLLFVATIFERNCKGIYSITEMNNNIDIITDEEEFKKFIKKLDKQSLGGSINQSLKSPQAEGLHSILDKARLARNEVAHSICSNLHSVFGSKHEENILEDRIKELARIIIEGEFISIVLLGILTKEEILPMPDIKKKRYDWVIDEE